MRETYTFEILVGEKWTTIVNVDSHYVKDGILYIVTRNINTMEIQPAIMVPIHAFNWAQVGD